jgi:hypothetical protein
LSEESAGESESEVTKWKDVEIESLLNHIQENYSAWSSGNKTKFYEAMANNVLSQYTGEQIKNKIGGLLRRYDGVKQKNNQTGAARTDWVLYDRMDEIFGHRETTAPSFLSDSTIVDIDSMNMKQEKTETKNKKQKTTLNSLGDAILAMSLSREKMWEKKYELQEKELEIKKEKQKLEVEKVKAQTEVEKLKLQLEHERQLKEMEYKHMNVSN